jgi:hypothetical protein
VVSLSAVDLAACQKLWIFDSAVYMRTISNSSGFAVYQKLLLAEKRALSLFASGERAIVYKSSSLM